MRACGSYRGAHALAFMRAQVVEDDDVARLERGNEELFDIGAEALAVDRAVEQTRRFDTVVAQSGQESRSLPVAVRNLVDQTLAAWGPASQARHVGLDPGFVDEHQTDGIDTALVGAPTGAMPAYVRTILLAGDEGLFLNVTPTRRKKRLSMEVSALTPRSARRRWLSASSVVSAFSARATFKNSR